MIGRVELADTTLEVREFAPTAPRWTFVHVHANEQASLASAVEHAAKHALRVRTLVHNRGYERNVVFRSELGSALRLDPNRMFSAAGIRTALRRLNGSGSFTERDVEVATAAGAELLSCLTGDARTWCAIHNNTDGGSLSINAYDVRPGSVADAVHVAEEHDPDDFFYTTSRALFDALRAVPANVVLQAPAVKDDGSLSVIAAQRGVPYLNIETEHGQPDRAARLLEIGAQALLATGVPSPG